LKEFVLVAGCNGYIGNALVQKLLFEGYKVVGIDNNIKYKWANKVTSQSIIPILSIRDKSSKFKKIGKFNYVNIDIAKEPHELKELLSKYQFDIIVNLAQQPSAPYSHLSLETATETMNNNINGTLNMLWLLSDMSPHIHYIEIESMGTMSPDIGIPILEGYFYPESISYEKYDTEDGLVLKNIGNKSLFPKRPGSIYHASKTANTYLVDCANRWWNLKITAINQGVVYGNGTKEIQETEIHSPLWVDEFFGTVVNRFIAQALLNIPLTIYGKGLQKRGFIGLNDSIQAIMLLIKNPPKANGVRFVNQLDEVFSIKQIADLISDNQSFIDTPRIENTDDFYYNPITDILKNLGFEKSTNILTEIEFALQHIDKNLLEKMASHFAPTIKWKKGLH
jgi:UDP-sulfoquinovose synthase